ncbi:MAG: tRNA (adenosine(37)-N6)-threonylcarbamoyltransferase complex transferase subunit TsaD [Verrucomicrobia bacterium]|nr:MAG: tRNA (adenosine(37)-N6)-threonylcarbamoyltransferase complex transferase subunit TsaD [Verrucomicrobiota bacterium]TAE87340.1 MAG: tRNA (adenosine(37)-N6)-threonylcarbamoyltransferase complex transferase subunit TsaD [Verrucomicrobiota bacterium]TAF25195.1 MAG: tRNA (adenosine(37)-N6)-threonylcarbamoyltransferase complex transferase subunit TsaD [Verrucomicrobiota bacterium]TAF40840.1 MAG: tRNA (adenosine(37)-N6)-threonylcarbamoyltransferase complex transferase subunit TsaD [Verrucomicro
MLLLAIESSCDETAVALLSGEPGQPARVLASEISSQIELHRVYGGVVPEIASRNHSLHLRPLVEQALQHAGVTMQEIDAFAATSGPGLASSLLVGATAAKAMAAAARKPFLSVNHLEGHLLSPFVDRGIVPEHLALIVSGGHTLLLDVAAPGQYHKLGGTRDDAAGEAFDKVAKMLGLPYPGGPEIEKIARTGDPAAFAFPRSMMKEPGFDFSFSGLKTAVLYTLSERNPETGSPLAQELPDLCASFQQAVIDVLVTKTLRAARHAGRRTIALSGGVSLNQALRHAFEIACNREGLSLATATPGLCTDNAAMIAFAALLRAFDGHSSPLDSDIDPNLPLVSAN